MTETKSKLYVKRPPQYSAVFFDGRNMDEVGRWASNLNRVVSVTTTYRNGKDYAELVVDGTPVWWGTWLVWEGRDKGLIQYDEFAFAHNFEEAT